MTIIAKYNGKCPSCGAAIRAGTRVEWRRGSKAQHTQCAVGSKEPQPYRMTDEELEGYCDGLASRDYEERMYGND